MNSHRIPLLRRSIAILLVICLQSAPGLAGDPSPASIRFANRENFRRLLVSRDLTKAARFLPYFDHPEGTEHELVAQFHLLACRPKAAQTSIDQITNPAKKDLFQAVLWSLVSIDTDEKLAVPGLGKRLNPASLVVTPLHEREIWRDEWPNIRIQAANCTQMPKSPTPQSRERLRSQARQIFSRLPQDTLMSDFTVVALAIEVGTPIPFAKEALAKFRDQHQNPYYQRLFQQAQDQIPLSQAAPLRDDAKDGIQLSPLSLKSTELVSHPIPVPILVREGPPAP